MRRLLSCLGLLAFVSGFLGTPAASAQQQSVNFFLGGFAPRSPDARGTNDVLFRNGDFLTFDIGRFNGATAGGEWLVGLTDWFDAGIGIGFYRRTTPAVYTGFVDADGFEIAEDLRLRIVPVTATMRLLPLGHRGLVRPYIGAGVGILAWRYSESGEFVDFESCRTVRGAPNCDIFRDAFVGSGTSAGPVVLGGLTFPIGSVDVGGEIRYQGGEGTLPASEDFAGSKIDLGGMNYLFVVNVRF